ncbi:recombinase family protein [bacterium]|nr:recombinase family protein [bacterium]
MKKIGYSYRRISSWKQIMDAEKGAERYSLDTQFQNAATWCKNNNVTLDTNFSLVDKAVSGFVGENSDTGKLRMFMEYLKEGIIVNNCYLLLDTWTRCSRADVSIQLETFLSITNIGATIVTLDDKQEYSKKRNTEEPHCWYIVIGKMIAANDFSRQISRSSKNTWARRRKETISEAKIFTKRCPEWLEIKDNEYVPIIKKVEVINKIFDLCIEGFGNQRIANNLNENKLETMSGRGIWQCSQIARILKNKKLIGIHEFTSCRKEDFGKRLPIKANGTSGYSSAEIYPKVISFDKWSKVRQLKEKRTTFNIQRESSKYVSVFANLLYCGYHGCTMKFINKGEYKYKDGTLSKKNGYYISTDAANNKKPYVRHGWHADMLEDAFFNFIPVLGVNLKDKLNQSEVINKLNENLAKLEHDIENKEKTIENYENDLENNTSSDTQRKKAYQGIEDGQTFNKNARAEISRIISKKESIDKIEQTRGTISEWLKEWQKRRDQENFRRSVNSKLKLVIDKIVLYGAGFKFNPQALNNYLTKLLKMIQKHGESKGLSKLNIKYISGLNEETYSNNHLFLDMIIREIITTHLPKELYQEAYSLYSKTRIADDDKLKRFFIVYPKNADGLFFQVKPEESFNVGHVNKYFSIRWFSFDTTITLPFGQIQPYGFKGYNPIYRQGTQNGENKYFSLDKKGNWYDGLPEGFNSYQPRWKNIL